MTASDPAAPQHESHDELHLRLTALEEAMRANAKELDAATRHRTRVETILGIAGAATLVVVIGALNLRDAVTRLEASGSSRDARIAVLEANASKRDTDDRGTREALVRLQTTVETLQSTIARRLDQIDQRLSVPPR